MCSENNVKNPAFVSVIVPLYNSENSVGDLLEALLNQSYSQEQYEIILVDDGSVDWTESVVKNHVARNPERNLYYIRQSNRGPAKARNTGVEFTSSQSGIVVFIDDDCVPEHDFIEEMIRPMMDNPEISGVQGRYITRQKGITPRFVQLEIEERYRLLRKQETIDFVSTYASAYKKDVFISEGMFDTSFRIASGEDTDFSYRLSQKGYQLVFNEKAVVAHRHPETLWEYIKQKHNRGYWRNLLYRKNPAKMLKDSYTPQALKLQVGLSLILALCFLFLPVAMYLNQGAGASLVLAGVFCLYGLSMVPFAVRCFGKDARAYYPAPLYIFIRGFSILAGMIQGRFALSR